MNNISAVTSFILTSYVEMENLKYVYFTVFLFLYFLILLANITIMTVVYTERSLHDPMYIFLCNLTVNGIYGSTALLPSLLGQLLSHSHEISLGYCLAQIYFLHTYGIVEFCVLAVMSYDRYVAICHPLHYHVKMSPEKVCFLIFLSWSYPFIAFGLYFTLTVKLSFCSNFIHKVYCINFELVKLSCFDTSIHSIIGLVATVFYMLPQMVVILFSYVQILKICIKASTDSRRKAFQTCTPHLFAVVCYTVGCVFEIVQSRFNMNHFSSESRMFLSLYFFIFPPLVNPVIYGISLQNMRVHLFKLMKFTKYT